MTKRVVLHVGTSKSGTTYLQQRMVANADRLRSRGVLWPGPAWLVQLRAVRELQQDTVGYGTELSADWDQILRQIADFDGDTAVLSMEWMSMLNELQRRWLVEKLGDVEIDVVITARDFVRQLTSQWQQSMRSYRFLPLDEYLDQVRSDRSDGWASPNFWKQQDVARLIKDWGALVGEGHVSVITVPPASDDPLELWRRFCSVVGVDPDGYEEGRRTNPSMGVVSTEFMRRLNERARGQGMKLSEHALAVRDGISHAILAHWRHEEGPVALPPEAETWARERGQRMIAEIQDSGATVVGDVCELLPGESPSGRLPSDVSDAELLAVAEKTVLALAEQLEDQRARLRRTNTRLRRAARAVAGDAAKHSRGQVARRRAVRLLKRIYRRVSR